MKRFNSDSKNKLAQAIFQDQPYLLITPNQDKVLTFKGSINDFEKALTAAATENAAILHVVKKVANSKFLNSPKVRFQFHKSAPIN